MAPEKILDMSDMSPLDQNWLVVYSRVSRGRLVKVILYSGDSYNPYSRAESHWLVEDLDAQLQMADTIIPKFARDIGFSPEGLVAVLQKYAPPLTTTER